MTKPLRDIPDQATVMVDANVVIYALFPQGRYHQSCKDLLQRAARSKIHLRLTVGAAADVIHRAMILECLAQGQMHRSADAVAFLKQHQQTVQQLSRYKSILGDLTQAKFIILPMTYRDLHASKQYREQYGLLTNDSLLLAVMRRERIYYLATNDSDFERVPGIAVRQPE